MYTNDQNKKINKLNFYEKSYNWKKNTHWFINVMKKLWSAFQTVHYFMYSFEIITIEFYTCSEISAVQWSNTQGNTKEKRNTLLWILVPSISINSSIDHSNTLLYTCSNSITTHSIWGFHLLLLIYFHLLCNIFEKTLQIQNCIFTVYHIHVHI